MPPPEDVIAPVTSKEVPVAAPMIGVMSVGVSFNTFEPEPVTAVAPVPPLSTDNVPVLMFAILRSVMSEPSPSKDVPLTVPFTWSADSGFVVPIPTFPLTMRPFDGGVISE